MSGPTPTLRLHHADPFGSPFQATVLAHAEYGGKPSIVLDRTGFYPESGGQMADRGVLAGVALADVQVDDAEVVHHVLEIGERPAVGAVVEGAPDRLRRRIHQALHTGQHMLSRALVDVAGAETQSSRLGETACTIDTPTTALREVDLARAEALVNATIDADVEVRAFFPDPETLARLPLRRAPKVTENIRVVQVGEFDCSPCGGTHCTRSAQVGFVRVEGMERYKGGLRITFNAGPRARQSLFGAAEALSALARGLTCGPADVGGAIDRLKRDLAAARETAGRLEERLAEQLASGSIAAAGAAPRFVLAFPGETQGFLRTLARRLVAVDGAVALLAAPGADGVRVLAARGPGATLDCGAFVKRLAQQGGGRGGGRPESAEGLLPLPEGAGELDWTALVAAVGP